MASGGKALAKRLSTVPRRPGVYLLKGPGEKILYVGKARDLRGRLRTYFQRSASLDMRKAAMVQKVRDFSYVVTENELEAFVLEANLIKQHRPRYNVLLRDDKSYPYLRLSLNEQWPRLEVVRRVKDDGAEYYGPYVPAGGMWEALSFIRRNMDIRPCRYPLERPMRPCVQHQMGRCQAPCAGLVGKDEYMKAVNEVRLFLKGRKTELFDRLRKKMGELSRQTRYEEAARVRDRLRALEAAMQSQKAMSPGLGDLDVVGFFSDEGEAVFQVFFVRGGMMLGARDFRLKGVSGVPAGELLYGFLQMLYSKGIAPPGEIILGSAPSDRETLGRWLYSVRPGEAGGAGKGKKPGVRITLPRRGRKLDLLRMAEENARLLHRAGRGATEEAAPEELKRRLGLSSAPESIGAFDVSNLAGGEAVGAFVFWAGGGFNKDLYRRVRIKTVAGVDDYAMMRETIRRVLKDVETPDLIVVDGGRGHLDAAMEAARGLKGGAEVVAVAKKPDRLFTPHSPESEAVDDRRPSSVLLRRIRDEAHRFAVTYHKKLREKGALRSPLEGVPGIGPKRRLSLLRHFKGLDAMRKATLEELASVPGMDLKAARSVKEHLG